MANVCTDENRKIILDNIFKFFRKNKGSNATIENLDLFIGSVFPNTDPAQFRVAHYATDKGIADMLEKFNVDVKTLLSTADRLVEPKSNIIESTASSEITDMFHGIPAGELFFRGRVNRQVSVNAWLGRPDAKTYVGDTETVSKNMQELKNDLFMNIQNFLISKNLLEGVKSARELFNGGEVDYDYYKKVMKAAGEFFFEGDFTMLNSYTNKKVPDISDGVAITDVIYEVYSDLIFLANFDSVIAKQFGHMIQISILDVDNLKGNVKHDKYKLKSSPESNMYWSNNSHSEEGVQSANFKLAEMIINTIPAYDKKGNQTTHYMENKDMYLLAAVIAQFELLHGNELLNDDASGYQYLGENSPKQFEWYLENIMESFRDRGTHAAILKQAFLPYANIIHSLHNFMHDETLNIAAKEKTADITVKEILGQILTNSYGAVYHIYNSDQLTIQQMFSQDFNATGIHNTVLSNMRTKAHDVNYFQIDPKKSQSGNANFEALFEGVDLSQDITELIGSNVNFTNQLGKYLYDKLGIKIDRDTLLDTAHELIAGTAHKIPTVGFFKAAMWNTLSKMNDDFVKNVIEADRTGMTKDQIAKEDAKAANFDSTAGKIISETVSSKFYNALLTSYLLKYPVKAVSTITTMSGEAIPAFKLANMTYKDTDLFSTQRKFEKNNNNHYRNMFIAGKAVIKGTSTRLEIVNDIKLDNMKPVNKSAGKMITIESFMADFNYDFLDNITKEKDASFNVMIGNYSDKSTILTKIIDAGWSDTENGVPLLKQDISAILEKVRTQGMNYYRDALKGVFDTYGELFKSAGIPHNALLFDVNNPASFEASVAEINRILANNDIKQIIAAANRPDIKIIEELHYSKYNSGFAMNQVLTDNYRIFSDPKRFDKFVDFQEKSFEDKYTAHDGSFGTNNTPFARINRKHLTALNLQDYKYDFTKLRAEGTAPGVDGEFNPVVRKWMWMNALARNEYLFMSTKGEYMHPQNYSQNTVDHRLAEIRGESDDIIDTAAYIETYTPAATKTTPAEIIAEMKKVAKNSDDIKLNAEETHYVSKKDPKKKYQRVSDFISEGDKPDENDPLIKSALDIGNLVDVLVRDFFGGKKMAKLDSYGISPELIKPFLEQLKIVKANMDARGEKVIANDVTLYDDELMIAGTVDLITYDPEGNVRIYDMKTMRGDQLKTQYYKDVQKNNGLSKYDSNEFGISNREKHTRQLSLYNILLNKTHGIKASTLGVMPIEVDYTPGDTTTKRLKLLPGIKIDIRNNVKSAKLEKESLYTVHRVKSFNRASVEADENRVYLFGDNTDDRLNTNTSKQVVQGYLNDTSEIGKNFADAGVIYTTDYELGEVKKLQNSSDKRLGRTKLSTIDSILGNKITDNNIDSWKEKFNFSKESIDLLRDFASTNKRFKDLDLLISSKNTYTDALGEEYVNLIIKREAIKTKVLKNEFKDVKFKKSIFKSYADSGGDLFDESIVGISNKYVPTSTQAVIRGLPNAIGIDTKKNRGTSEGKTAIKRTYSDPRIRGENISSRGSGFAQQLTNAFNNVGLHYRGLDYVNSEHAYQTWKTGEFSQEAYEKKGGKLAVDPKDLGDTLSIMTDILKEKFIQNPSLIQGVTDRGGLEYIEKSTHHVNGTDSFWETKGENNFIKALAQAAREVGIPETQSVLETPALSMEVGFTSTEIEIEIKGKTGKDFLFVIGDSAEHYKVLTEKQPDGTYKSPKKKPSQRAINILANEYVPAELQGMIKDWQKVAATAETAEDSDRLGVIELAIKNYVESVMNSSEEAEDSNKKLLLEKEVIEDSSYFTDADFPQFKRQVDKAIKQAKESGKIIVIPTDGIGTGKAELEKRAPRLFAYLTQQLNSIEDGTAGKPRDVTREAVKSVNFASDFSEDYWEDYFKEVGERLIVMSKRNVANTATFENALRNSRLGTDNIINHATVEDWKAAPFSITGEKKYKTKDGKIIAGQDAHDGSSYLSYIHSKMIDASYPGKGYEGTKKRFGTIVTEHGAMVKKDAESEITNRKIRNSESAEIPFYQLKKKMESLPINDLNLGFEKEYFDEHYFDHLNTIYQVKKVKLYKSGDQHYIDLDTIHVNKQGQPERGVKTFPVNSLFEMWEVFGAQHSSDENGNYTEGSNDLVYDVVVGAVNNKLVNGLPTAQYGALKQKLIHIVSNKSAVKSGATNLNSIDTWTTDAPLSYATFETAFMGPQLDASHDVEDSSIREITQIISALAQNGYTSEWAREAYEDIQNIIQDASVPYMKHLTGLKEINMSTEESKKKFYRYLSDRFINSIHKTQGNNIAKTLVTGLRQDGVQIPFSNQNFYSAFVKDIITRMNTDFISRNYPGIGAVLTPSEGIIQMYDVFVNGDLIAVTHEDLSKEALRNYNEASYKRQYGEVPKNNTEVIRNYIQQTLRDSDILLQDIEIGDIIRVDGVEYNLKTPEDYYEFKRIHSKNEVSDVLANNPELARIGSRAANLSADGKGSYLAEDLYARYRGGESFLEDYSPDTDTVVRSKVAPTIQKPSQRPPTVGSKLDIRGFSNFMDSLEGQIIPSRANKKVSPTIDNNRTYFKKVHNKPRDLKPTLHKFTHNGTNYNIFDLQSIKFRYYLENLSDLTLKGQIEPSELETFNNLLTYINNFYLGGNELVDADSVVNNPKMVRLVKQFLSGWTQRNLGLLENNLIMDRVNANTDFHEYFKGDDVTATALPDVIDKYKNNKVTNVKFRAAELILGDIYKGMFDRTDNESMYEVFKKGEQFFADKILKNYENDPVEADLKIITSKMANPIYVRFVEELPRSENNVPLRRFIDERGIDETRNYARFDNNNQPIYQVPDMNNVVVNSENGSDVVYIKWSHDSFEGVHTMQYTFNKTVDRFFKSFGDGLKTVVPLMRENSQFQVRNEDQTTRVFDINQLSLDLFNKNMNLNFKMDLKKGEVFNRQKDIASLLGRRVFASWQKSHEVVSARIPAQSMQSFMPMRNVAYNLGGKNDAYVSISQIWLQGSDFDIDKAYILGYSFNSKGNYNSWSSLTDYSSKEQLDALNLLPKANNQTVTISNTKTAVDMSSLYNELMSSRFVQDPESLDADSIKVFNRMIRKINKAKSNEISFTGVKEDPHFNFNVVAELINRHNNPKGGRDYTNSLKNKVSAKIQQIISAPSNQLVANSPITISDWHRTVDEVLERRKSLEEVHPAVESLFEDVNSKNQFTNKGVLDESTLGELSVMLEKKHPGLEMVHLPTGQGNIIAVLKAGQTIEQYIEAKKADSASVIFYTPKFLNGMLKNKRRYERQITTTLSPYDGMSYYIMQQNASVGKEDVGIAANGVKSFFALTDYFNDFYNNSSEMTPEELMKSNQMFQVDFVFKVPLSGDINFKSNTISDLQIRNADSEKIRSVLNSQFKQKFSNAALILSGLLSAATDNAKELLMAKINATPDLFSMHLYMAVLGMDMDQIVEIMTSDVANDVVKRTENNLFVNKHNKGIAKIFKELHDGYTKRGQTEQAHNILVFKQIYESSKEFSSLAGLLGINQKRKANTWEVYNYLTRLEKLFRETTKNRFEDLKLDKAPFTDDSKANVVARILEINPVMKNYPDHVAKIVNQASNIVVEYTDFDGQIRKKSVNVILDGMDFRLYLKDEKYKKIVKDYYNLIKHTFNVFDVVDNVPHFKGMIDSLILTHDVLLNSSEKYKFVYGIVQDIVNIGHTLNDNFKKNHVDQKTVNSASTFFDGAVIEKWLRDEMGHINFNVKDIMKLAEVDTYNVYTSDLVKDRVNPGGQDPSAQVVKKGDSSNPVIALNSTYNIAMFKKIMEDMILPIIQKKTNSEFLESLKIETVVNNFGIKSPTIVSIHSLQELNTPVSIDQYQKLLKDFDFLDSDEKLKGLFKNNVGTEMKIRDMFFLYNLIVHNEKYGNKKLTPLMENYMKERTSLGYKYLEYYSKVDKGEVDIWEDMKIKYGDGWKEQLENNIFFHINSYRGSAVITRNGKRITMRITNPHITMMTDVNYVRDFGKNYTDINDVLSLIRENGWAVNLKC